MNLIKKYFKSKNLKLMAIALSIAFVLVIGVSNNAQAAVSGGAFAGVAAADLVVGAANADYNVSFDTNIGATATTITLTFPAGYTITNGSLGTSSVCNSGCSLSGFISVDGVNRSIDSVIGSAAGKTITITLTSAFDLGTGTGTAFRVTSGITNPTTSGSSGTFTITNNAAGEAEQSGITAVTLTPGTATQLVFTTQPSGSVSGVALTGQPTVTARDQYGNTDTNYTSVITLTESSLGSITANSTTTAVAGVATSTTLTYTATADQEAFTLVASDGSLTSAASDSVTSNVVATKILVNTQPGSIVSGVSMTQPVIYFVDANDTLDTVANTDTITISENGNGSATGTLTVSASNGIATFTDLIYTALLDGEAVTFTFTDDAGGTYNFNGAPITSDALTADVVATKFLVTLASNTPTAGSADTMTLTAANSGNITDTGYDSTGKSYTFVDSVASAISSHVAPDTTAPTIPNDATIRAAFANGVASLATFTLPKAEVLGTITVSDGSLSGTSASVTVKHAATSQFTVTVSDTTPTTGTAVDVTIVAKDTYENTADGANGATAYSGTVFLSTSATAATWSTPWTTFTATSTKTLSGAVTFNTAESGVTVTAADSAGTITGTVSSIDVSSSDPVAPTVSSIYPTNGATSVAITAQPYIEFSEAMNASTITTSTIQLRNSSNDSVVSSNIALGNGNRRAIIMPATSLSNNTAYYLYATTGVQDANGNALAAAYGATSTSQFTTIGSTATISAVGISISSTTSTISWTTDVNSTSNTVEYGTTSALGSTSAATTGDGVTSHSASLTGLTANTLYYYRVKSTAGGSVQYSDTLTFTTAPTAVTVTGISATQSYATADNTYGNGWVWVFDITVPDSETTLKMKFANWVSGSNTIATANNIRYYSAQSSDRSAQGSAVTVDAAATYPSTSMTLNSDLDSSKGGRQIRVTVEMKVPVSTAGGSYSTSYGVLTQ